MPITLPTLDDRTYQDLVSDALARIPVHNPEWTNFNESDPGVTLLEVFAFLTDSLLYRANQIPDRNRLKFLTLLGVPLQPGASAQGLATLSNAQGPPQTFSLNPGLEVRAGKVPFRTQMGLDVLPIEAMVYYKQPLPNPDQRLKDYYNQLYLSYTSQPPYPDISLYQLTALTPSPLTPVDLTADTTDGSLWIALLARAVDAAQIGLIKTAIAGRTLTLGILPGLPATGRRLGVDPNLDTPAAIDFWIPNGGVLPNPPAARVPSYALLPSVPSTDVLSDPGVVEITLPSVDQLSLWTNLQPTEAGAGNFPPAIDDATIAARLITWIRLTPRAPASAGPEVPVVDPRFPPGTPAPPQDNVLVFVEDPEAGQISFGDGTRGKRPPAGARLLASYDYSLGPAGNLGAGAINSAPALPPGLTVSNPIPTWGGAATETVSDGEKQITRYLQHRDRLVTQADFETITWRTPGVSIGRVDVLPAFHPVLSPNEPGDAPGVVTLMVLSTDPRTDADPSTQQQFLTAVSNYLAPRRLVTTEIFLRGPTYNDIWVSVGIDVVSGASSHDVMVAVRSAIQAFLSPLPQVSVDPLPKDVPLVSSPSPDTLGAGGGWPLRKPVLRLEILAVASRVPGVMMVSSALLAGADGQAVDQVAMVALQLPRLAGLSITQGDAVPIADVQGQIAATPNLNVVPVPVVPEDCC